MRKHIVWGDGVYGYFYIHKLIGNQYVGEKYKIKAGQRVKINLQEEGTYRLKMKGGRKVFLEIKRGDKYYYRILSGSIGWHMKPLNEEKGVRCYNSTNDKNDEVYEF
ncbi:hypothetical protein [Carboxylicivirga caseinilyticus]|uniref:hypothetical protein n=1 Tax=Carboxylicivirga caseinilyticus TaxID=3417572 RepID=UPI003D33D2BF|nr:hypothetical protein [Marinilabiliaceae bacterium A049]